MSAQIKTHQTSQPVKAEKSRKPERSVRGQVKAGQLLEAPETLRPEDVLAAQQQVGNQVVQRALDKTARRESVTDEQGNLIPEITSQIQSKRGGGSPLPESVQQDAGKKLGRNFKNVRIHTDPQADQLSRTINARAFTIGSDIFFKSGVFSPETSAGRETIIHELTHVVQQGGGKGAGGKLKLGATDTAMEKEADKIGKKHSRAAVGGSSAASGTVQKQSEEDELQMQADEEELQMQGEEDELQMQADEEELQMQSDEEEELQAQPDAGGIVQRDPEHDERKKIREMLGKKDIKGNELKEVSDAHGDDLKKISKVQRTKKEVMGDIKTKVPTMNLGNDAHKAKLKKLDESANPSVAKMKVDAKRGKVHDELKQKVSSFGLGSDENKAKLAAIDKKQEKNMKSNYLAEQKAGTSGFLNASIEKKKAEKEQEDKTKKETGAKEQWAKGLSDPNLSKEEREKNQDRLKRFHGKEFGSKQFKEADTKRKKSLEEAAKGGDDKAYEKMVAEQKAEEEDTFAGRTKKAWNEEVSKPLGDFRKNLGANAIKGVKKGAGLLGSGIKSLVGGQLKSGLSHFFGVKSEDKDDDDDEKEKKGKKGKGDSGMGSIMEEYAKVLQENKELKAKLGKPEEKPA